MKMSAWSKVASIGLLGSLLAVGCVVGESDEDEPTGGTGGVGGSTGGKSGSGTGGTGGSTGGSAGTGGSTGGTGGGTGGTGGSGGIQCDPDGTLGGTPAADCAPVDPGDTCQECIQTNCCQEWKDCLREAPDNVCAWGGPNDEGEIICFQNCVKAAVADGGVADDETQGECAGSCTTPGCSTIGDRTNDMIACVATNCVSTCLAN
jgi:hypothetical protein